MPVISIEQDAAFRRDGDRFVEICRRCREDRAGDRCACGTAFVAATSNKLVMSWDPTTLVPTMPAICPHCEAREPALLRSVTMELPTSFKGRTRMTIEFRTCKRVPPPFLSYLLLITAVFFVVVFGLMALFGTHAALVPLALALGGAWLAWRSYGWLRFARFDHRSIRLRARRRGYALAVAEANRGRLL